MLIGNGTGGFAPAVSFLGIGGAPFAVSTADFNSDGKLDIATANINANTASVFINITPNSTPNSAPTDISLTLQNVSENQPAGTVVSTLSSTDPDVGNAHSYNLVSGLGASGNGSFQIAGNQLRSNVVFDFETQSSYSIRIRSTDGSGLSFNRVFTIAVTNVNEAPYGNSDVISTDKDVNKGFVLAGTDPENQPLTYAITQLPVNGILAGTAPNLTYTPNFGFIGTDEIYYTVSDGVFTSTESRIEIGVVGLKPSVAFSLSSSTVNESVGSVTVSAQLSFAVSQDMWFPITVSAASTASLNSDYLQPDSSVKISAGQTSGFTAVQIVDDSFYEPGNVESLILNLNTGYAATLGAITQHTISITDNDPAPSVAFKVLGATVEEKGIHTVQVLLSTPSTQTITVPYSVDSRSSATANSDYGSITPSSITFAPGAVEAKISIPLIDDSTREPVETLSLILGTPTNAVLARPQSFVLTILDNDTPTVSLTTLAFDTHEKIGTLRLFAYLSEPAKNQLSFPIGFSGTANRSINAGDGDIRIPSEAPAFVFRQGSSSASLTFTVNDDNLNELKETFIINLLDPRSRGFAYGSIKQTVVSIVDDDRQVVSFALAAESVWEDSGVLNVIANLASPAISTFKVPVLVTTGSQNYASSPSDYSIDWVDFEFTQGQSTASRKVNIIDGRFTNEPTESVLFAFNPPSDAQYDLGAYRTFKLEILDNEPIVQVMQDKSTVSESDSFASYIFSLNAPSNKSVTVDFVVSGTAVADTDYKRSNCTAISCGPVIRSVTIKKGYTSSSITVPLLDDTFSDGDKTLTVGISKVTGGKADKTKSSATTTIEDNEVHGVGLAAVGFVRETREKMRNGSLTSRDVPVTVFLARVATRDVSVDLEFAGTAKRGGVDSDYSVKGLNGAEQIIIYAGSRFAKFRLVIRDDKLHEGPETILIRIKNASAPATLKSPNNTLSVTIVDDDKPAVTKPAPPVTATTVPRATTFTPVQTGALDLVVRDFDVSPSTGSFGSSGTSGSSSSSFEPFPAGSLNIGLGTLGPIEGGTVFFDINFDGVQNFVDANDDGVLDDDELSEPSTETAIDGSFGMILETYLDTNGDNEIDATEGRWVIEGGVDISTQLPWPTRLTSPVGLYTITPLTTLVESLVRTQGFSLSNALTRVTAAMGVPNYNLATGNSLYEVLAYDDLSARAYKAHVQLYSSVLEISNLLAGNTGLTAQYFADRTFTQIAALISVNDAFLDLTSPTIVEGILRSVEETSGVTGLNEETVTGASLIIAQAQQRLDSIQLSSFTTGSDFLLQVNKTKKILQGSLADAMFAVGAGTKSIATATSEYTGSALDTLITDAPASVTVPPAVGINSASIVEGQSGTTVLRLSVSIVGDHSYPVSIQYATTDGTALVGSDYTATSGTINWLAGNNDTKYVDITITGDTLFEEDESFIVLLSNPVGVVVRQSEGFGFIANDEATTITTTGNSLNRVFISHSVGNLDVTENSIEMLSGQFSDPVSLTVAGKNDVPDQLSLDFSADSYRSDQYAFQGGSGGGILDTFTAQAGVFNMVEYSILGTNDSRARMIPSDFSDRVRVDLQDVESALLSVSLVENFVLRLPAWVSSIIIEDSDSNSEGRTRIRSSNNQFAPIDFTNPELKLFIVTDSANTIVTIDNVDAGMLEKIQILPAMLALSNDQVLENSQTGTTIGTLSFPFPIIAGTGNTFTYSLVNGIGDTDNTSFTVNDGTLKTAASFDFETISSYSIRVRATDQDGVTYEEVFTIQVTDVNESPLITSSPTFNVAESTIIAAAVTGNDPEGLPLNYGISGGTDAGAFTIDSTTGILTFVAAQNYEVPADSDSNNIYNVTISVSDGFNPVTTQALAITVTNINPTLSTDSDGIPNTISEGFATGAGVGVTASSTDPIGPDVIYSLTNDAGGRFTINANTGVVTVANGSLLDGPTTHTITVRASDGAGGTSTADFEIDVTNVAPTATISASELITYGAEATIAIANQLDPSTVDTLAGFRYAYATSASGLSSVTYATANASVSQTFSGLAAGSHTLFARIIDKDDGFTDYNTIVTVDKASLTVSGDAKSKTYGAAEPVLTFTPSGTLYYGDTYSVISGVVLSSSIGSAATAGTHVISTNGGTASNYVITHVDGTLSVDKAAALIATADNKLKVYGAADPVLTYTPSGNLYYGDTYSVISGISLATATGAAATAGSHLIDASGGTASNYEVTTVDGTLSVDKAAALTATADNKSKVYGAADPLLTYTPSGNLYYGDAYSVISGVSLATATGAAATAGSHLIDASGGTAANYEVTTVDGTLSVDKAAALTATADNKSKVYGAAEPLLTYTPSGTLYYGDAYFVISGISLTTATGAVATAGSHLIDASGGTAANYEVTTVDGTLSVDKAAALTATADNKSKVYGAADPVLTYTPSGTLYYGDAYSIISGISLVTAMGAAATAGSHPIEASGGTASNYEVTTVDGTLLVDKAAALTATADNKSKVYGAADPVLTYTPSGTLYYGDAYSVIGGISLATAMGAAATAGTHPIDASGGTASNYQVTTVDGTLSVAKAATLTTVTIVGAPFTYTGSAQTPATVSVTGAGGLSLTPPADYVNNINAGTARASYSYVGDDNYFGSTDSEDFTIDKASTSVTAIGESFTYDGTAHAGGSATVSGAGIVTGSAVLSYTGDQVNAGSYTVIATYAGDDNHTGSSDSATVVVNKANQAIAWSNPGGIAYGTALSNVQLNATVAGVVGGTAPGALVYNQPAGTVLNAGNHQSLIVTAAETSNYNFATATVFIDVAKVGLTVTANSVTRVYSASTPAFTASYSGFVNGDDPADLTGTLGFSPANANTLLPGSYPIVPSGLTSINYTVTYVSGTLTILPIGLVNGQLVIVGTDGRDVIHVTKGSDNTLRVSTVLNRANGNQGGSDGGSEGGSDEGADIFTYSLSAVTSILILGLGGNDHLHVSKQVMVPVTIDGGAGDDSIWGGGGNDTILDLIGNNWIDVGGGNNIVTVGDGNNRISAGGSDSGSDGSPDGNNTIVAGNGNNNIVTSGGIDSITTGNGNNEVRSGAGNDVITTGSGRDLVDAGAGNDMVRTGAGDDSIQGGDGDDILIGGDGADLIQGGQGRDFLIGGIGADRLVGNQDEDILIAGYTAYDNNDFALSALMREWTSGNSNAIRIVNITNGTGLTAGYRLVGDNGALQTVFNDNDVDTLTGSQGTDWFFANRIADNGGVLDIVTDEAANELWNDTDFF